ncbi:MAG TPA: peptide deformylase [Gammaproteobacteria bacterium]|nr:peptide deformylase [Gammaproteobacteria bacterium]
MSILNILQFPDPKLRQKAAPVASVDDRIRTLVDDMFETMYSAPGIGLAAVQVEVLKRVIVIDISEDKSQPKCFINPEIIECSGHEKMDEGCLSVPGIYEPVSRAKDITVRYLDREGKAQELTVDGLLAVCIQHEMDHLDGKLFVDYLSEMKRNRIRKKMEKMRQHTL